MTPIKKTFFLLSIVTFSFFCSTYLFNFSIGHAEGFVSDTPAGKEINLQTIAGLYWKNHRIGFAPFIKENEETVTDVLEVVPYDDQSAYIRTQLYFTNGHTCTFHGIAKKEHDHLSYYDSNTGKICIMDIKASKTTLTIIDRLEQCRFISCGVRGGYGATFSVTKKRPITYMDKLKHSPEYQEAVVHYKKRIEAEKAGIKPEWADAKNNLERYVSSKNIDGVRESIAQGANPNIIKEKGRTIVTAAAYSRNIEITKLLLDAGLDINAVQQGETLLTRAAHHRARLSYPKTAHEMLEYIQWLLEQGADVDFVNENDETALDIAKRTQADPSVIDLLSNKTKD